VDERAAVLGQRSIKAESQQAAIRLAISMVDLMTLEGQDTPGTVAQLAAKGRLPGAHAPRGPVVRGAVCLPVTDPRRAPGAGRDRRGGRLRGHRVPAGLTSLELKLEETRQAVADGAEEIDVVIPRDAYLSGDDQRVITEVEQVTTSATPNANRMARMPGG
jgi:deoxyribose-phosphate aldolase